MGDWRALIAETVTGTVVADVTPRDTPSFTRALTDKGTWTINVLPEDRGNAALDLHSYTDAGRYSWAVLYDNYVAQAGPVWTYQFDENTRNLSVSGSGIQGLLDRRVLRNPAGNPATIAAVGNDEVLTGLSLWGIAREVVARSLTPTGYGLPLDVPATAAGVHKRTYQGYDLAMVWDRLVELSKVDGGPELDFRPYLSAAGNLLRWETRIGAPTLGNQGSAAVWDYGGALSQIDIDVNGAASPCTTAYVKGSGADRAMVSGYATDPALIALGYPPTDLVDNDHTSATVAATLTSWAVADLATFRAPQEKWKCSVRIDGTTVAGVSVSPPLGTWVLGDAPRFGVTGHPWIPQGSYRRRILGFSSDTAATVTLDLATTLEVL
jgi:hypothetical protein